MLLANLRGRLESVSRLLKKTQPYPRGMRRGLVGSLLYSPTRGVVSFSFQRLQCLPWDAETGLRWAALLEKLRASGLAMPIRESLIAATGLVHHLVIATHNRPDFQNAGVKIVDPVTARN
jgi:predicted nucleic acid-binding protein